MNTIKIYLAESGALAQLQKDFPLYQFQYNNKLLNIYVPKSICVGPFIDNDVTSGFVCVVSMKATNSNGVQKQTGAFACRFVKTLVQNGIEYNLFERTLPYSFTQYAGQDQTAPTIYVSILNVSDGSLISMISSQTVHLDVMESNDQFDADFDVDPSAAVELQAQIDAITSLLPNKQNADTTYDGEGKVINQSGDNHKVVDNINALLSATADLPDLRQQVEDNTADIADLKAMSIYGWNVVGTHEIKSQSAQDDNAIPSDADLISWIEALKGAPIAKGDAIYIYWDNFAVADDVSLFWYAETESQGSKFRQVPFMIHTAGNSVAGLIEGTYAPLDLTGKADQLMVDILNGNVVNVYKVKHDESGLISLKDVFDVVQNKLIDGTQAVAKAIGDEDGLRIKNNYWKTNDGKRYVQDYASPKALYDLNYPDYATGEFKKENVNDNSYNKTTNSSSIGYTPLSVIGKNLEADILLGDQNGLVNRVWINSNATESIKLRIATAYADENNVSQTLSIVETETFLVVAGIPVLKQIESVFSGLTTPITLPSGTAISQTIEVWRESSVSADFTLLCNETYDAYMTFNKIGFVRYSLEAEPDAIVSGHDSAPTIDGNGDLVITSTDGEINYMNGKSAPLTTILKVPMASGINNNEIKPPKARDVKIALDDKVDYIDITGWTSPLTSAQLSILANAKMPILTNSAGEVFFLKDLRPYEYKFISQGSGDGVNRYILMEINKFDGTITYHEPCVADDSAIAPVFSTSRTYAVGDLVTFGGDLYICTTAVTTAGDFDPSNWTSTNVKDEIKKVKVKANEITCHQLVNFTSANDTTYTEIINGQVIDIKSTLPSNRYVNLTCNITNGHKYYVSATQYNRSYEYTDNNGGPKLAVTAKEQIITATETATITRLYLLSGQEAGRVGYNIFDLTADYGAGQEPSLEECQKIYRVPYGYGENKISVLEDSKKITSFQTPIQAKVVNFNQLVANEYTHNWTLTQNVNIYGNTNITGKIYVCIEGDFDASKTAKIAINGLSVFSINANYHAILDVANSTYADIRLDIGNPTISKCMVIDLTALFGAGSEPTLAQCQALFNADYYNYTSGKDMQLIYDGEKPIALVEIPKVNRQLYNHDIAIFNNTNPQTIMMSVNLINADNTQYNLTSFINAVRAQGSGTQRIQCSGTILYNSVVYVCSYIAITSSVCNFVCQKATNGETADIASSNLTINATDVVRPL